MSRKCEVCGKGQTSGTLFLIRIDTQKKMG